MLLPYDKNKMFLLLYDNNWALCQEKHMVSMIKKSKKERSSTILLFIEQTFTV